MIFTSKAPEKEGMFWAYICIPDSKPTLEVGTVTKISNGWMRVVAGAFDFDWAPDLYWGDEIPQPEVEIPEWK